MKRKIIRGIVCGVCLGMSVITMAESKIVLKDAVETVVKNKEWPIESEAPGLEIIIKDGYRNAGRTEKLIIELDGAKWLDGDGTSVTPMSYTNLKTGSVAISKTREGDLQLNVDIPSSIKIGRASCRERVYVLV